MEMTVDDEVVSHLSSPGSTELNTDGIVWIGLCCILLHTTKVDGILKWILFGS